MKKHLNPIEMKKYFQFFSCLALGCCLVACNEDDKTGSDSSGSEADDEVVLSTDMWLNYFSDDTFTDATYTVSTDETADDYNDYVENVFYADGDDTRDVTITYSNDTAYIEYPSDETKEKTKNALTVTVSGAHVTILNDSVDADNDGRARVNYILKGSSTNGSLRVYSAKKFMVTLDDITLTNAYGAAINVQKLYDDKKRMYLNVADGTTNTLCDAEVYSDTVAGEDDKATIFNEGKIIIYGGGTLHVTGLYKHAIASDDYIRIHSGVTLVVDSAAKDGIHTDKLYMTGGLVKVFANKDAVQADTTATDEGFILEGGRLLTCGKRAMTANPFEFNGGQFCLIGEESQTPTNTSTGWIQADSTGYVVVLAE